MIIDKSINEWLITYMYEKTHIDHIGQYPIGLRFHLGVIDNHKEIRKIYESPDEFYSDKLMGKEGITEELKNLRNSGAYLFENNEAYDYENCTPTLMKSVKNDHWEYLRTNTWWGERCRTVFGFKVHTYFPEEGYSYVLFWNWVYQEFLLRNRVKTERPTSTINPDDTVETHTFSHDGLDREIQIVTSTKDTYRNHTESLKETKIFCKPGENALRVLYK